MPTLRCECAQPGLIDTMRKWSILHLPLILEVVGQYIEEVEQSLLEEAGYIRQAPVHNLDYNTLLGKAVNTDTEVLLGWLPSSRSLGRI